MTLEEERRYEMGYSSENPKNVTLQVTSETIIFLLLKEFLSSEL
jgi:hypothetical protein